MLHNFVAMCWWFPWVMSHVWMSQITTYLCGTENRERNSMWVLSLHISGAGDSPASCHTFDWVMSHVWMSHVTRINESFYMCDIKRYVVIGLRDMWSYYMCHHIFFLFFFDGYCSTEICGPIVCATTYLWVLLYIRDGWSSKICGGRCNRTT